MSTHDRPRLTRRAAEQLLDDPGSSSSALGRLLSVAGFPQAGHGSSPSGNTPTGPWTVDPARENAAVAAFVAARLAQSPTAARVTAGRRAARRAVVATAALVSVTTGGFALAATGNLPILPDQASDRATDAVAQRGAQSTVPTSPSTTGSSSTDAGGSERPGSSGKPGVTGSTDAESQTPTPHLEGLCKAFQAGDKAERGKSLESAAFAVLVAAAGGPGNVATYCVDLVGEPKAKPTRPTQAVAPTKPTHAATPTKPVKPTQAATPTKPAKPTPGKPTDKGKPTDRGKPASTGTS